VENKDNGSKRLQIKAEKIKHTLLSSGGQFHIYTATRLFENVANSNFLGIKMSH